MRNRQFFPMSCLCFSQIHSRSSCSEVRSCGKPDLLRINSCSCTDPICRLRCHFRNWSSMLLLHSESFVNLNVVSLQNDSPLVSNKHLFSILESSGTGSLTYSGKPPYVYSIKVALVLRCTRFTFFTPCY